MKGNKKTWADFQILSSTYRETIRSQGEIWMNSPAIRLSLSSRLKVDMAGMDIIGLIIIDYQVCSPYLILVVKVKEDDEADKLRYHSHYLNCFPRLQWN